MSTSPYAEILALNELAARLRPLHALRRGLGAALDDRFRTMRDETPSGPRAYEWLNHRLWRECQLIECELNAVCATIAPIMGEYMKRRSELLRTAAIGSVLNVWSDPPTIHGIPFEPIAEEA